MCIEGFTQREDIYIYIGKQENGEEEDNMVHEGDDTIIFLTCLCKF